MRDVLSVTTLLGQSFISQMHDKFHQAFVLAYLIGWFLARMPKKK